MRFISCVALHATWTGAAAIAIHRHRATLEGTEHWLNWLFQAIAIVFVPMVLHGLYDTLLKKDHDALALFAAVASVAWLAWQIEKSTRKELGSVGGRAPAMAV